MRSPGLPLPSAHASLTSGRRGDRPFLPKDYSRSRHQEIFAEAIESAALRGSLVRLSILDDLIHCWGAGAETLRSSCY